MMFDSLAEFAKRPEPFSVYTAADLWTHPHVAKQMLHAHLDPNTDLASRRVTTIDASVAWIDDCVPLRGKKVCDLGCGPGLYTTRFFDKGAHVIGIDFSSSSLSHARSTAKSTGRSIEYVQADYTQIVLPQGLDLCTLIFGDFCALSGTQRSSLLGTIRQALAPNGYFLMDVFTEFDLVAFTEREEVAERMMNGFWAAGDYIGLLKSFKYDAAKASLERYLIVEPDENREIFNWLQYFSPTTLEIELERNGFQLQKLVGSLAGDPVRDDSRIFGVVAQVIK